MSFPSSLPLNCPLPSAIDCGQVVFMAFQSQPVTSEQCQTQAERNRAVNAVGDAACTRHGLSVFPTLVSCTHHVKLFPRLGPYVGKANLTSPHGKIAATGSAKNPAHMTWWPYEGVKRNSLFIDLQKVESE